MCIICVGETQSSDLVVKATPCHIDPRRSPKQEIRGALTGQQYSRRLILSLTYHHVPESGDPHMTGFLGQKFDFTGEDGGWYCLIKDDNMQVSMRVTTPVPSVPEITYITGLSVLTKDVDGSDHDIVIQVKDPYNLDSSCPEGVSPCLADGALAVVLDGEETLLAPGTVSLGAAVEVSAANLPGACRSFGFDKVWWSTQNVFRASHFALG